MSIRSLKEIHDIAVIYDPDKAGELALYPEPQCEIEIPEGLSPEERARQVSWAICMVTDSASSELEALLDKSFAKNDTEGRHAHLDKILKIADLMANDDFDGNQREEVIYQDKEAVRSAFADPLTILVSKGMH